MDVVTLVASNTNILALTNSLSVLGAVFALCAWVKSFKIQKGLVAERERMNQKITILLQQGDQSYRFSAELLRSELTRSEVLGRLGMLTMKVRGERYKIKDLNTREFLEQISALVEGTGDGEVVIKCSETEFDQFDFSPSGPESHTEAVSA